METNTVLDKALLPFQHYYDIRRDNITLPFDAEADFISHGEQYVLIKAAKISEMDSTEFAYFKIEENLSTENLTEYCQKAWNAGLSRVNPHYGLRNSDITLVIIADIINEDTKKLIKKIKFYKSYKLSIWGWSHFKLVAKELSTGMIYHNRFGESLKKVLINI